MSNKPPQDFRAISQQMFVLTVLGTSGCQQVALLIQAGGAYISGVSWLVDEMDWPQLGRWNVPPQSTCPFLPSGTSSLSCVCSQGVLLMHKSKRATLGPNTVFEALLPSHLLIIHVPEQVTRRNLESGQRSNARRGEESTPHHASQHTEASVQPECPGRAEALIGLGTSRMLIAT